MNCRIHVQKLHQPKVCPAFRTLQRTLALGMYGAGEDLEYIAASVGYRSRACITMLAKRSGVPLRGRWPS